MSISSFLIAFLRSYLCKKTASIIRLRYTMHKKNITAQYLYLPMHISDIKCNLIGQSLFRRFQLISQNFPDISNAVQHRIAVRIQFCCHSLNTSIMLQICLKSFHITGMISSVIFFQCCQTFCFHFLQYFFIFHHKKRKKTYARTAIVRGNREQMYGYFPAFGKLSEG